jgi:RHS repeat-associated protein
VAAIDRPLTDDTITYAYDQVGRVTTRAINWAANTVTWAFDALGRVTSETNVLGAFAYTYDGPTSRVATVTYPNGQTCTYSYLPAIQHKRLQTIHHRYPTAATLSKFDYTYDAVGNILTWRQQADTTAVVWRYGYDAADQVTRAVKHSTDTQETILQRFAYAYDPAGNRTVEQIDDAATLSSYDTLNRITAQAPGGPLQVAGTLNEPGTVTIAGTPASVDASNGFRGTAPATPGTTTFTVVARDAAGNQLTQAYEVDVAGAWRTLTYDASGNLTSDGTRTFEWDARNQLVAVNTGTGRTEFRYNEKRQRSRTIHVENGVPQSDVATIWCATQICEERDYGTNTVRRRDFQDGIETGSGDLFVTLDHLGSPAEVSSSAGALLGRWSYDAFGRAMREFGTTSISRGFTGHEFEATTGLGLAPYRAYDPALARWLSEDPLPGGILAGDGPNLYWYSRNSPIRYVDPLGLVCGSAGNDWIVPDSHGAWDFSQPCQNHDWCYEDCADTREGCDIRFWNDLMKRCKRLKGMPRIYAACVASAKLYYTAVHWFGESSYNCTTCE